HALPVEPSLLLLLAPCILALLGLEFGHRVASACLAGVVVVVITVTIGGWVLHQTHWLGYNLFATPGAEQFWFPSAHGVAGAVPIALLSLVILLTASARAPQLTAPLGWATGLGLLLAVPMHYAILAWYLEVPTTDPRINHLSLLAAAPLMLCGLALLCLAPTRGNKVEFSARLRALMVVVVVASTLALWHAVRAAEIGQLRNEVKSALDETMRDFRNGIAANNSSIERLNTHLATSGWKIPPAVFLANSRAFLRDYLAGAAVIVVDTEGRPLQAARRGVNYDANFTSLDPILTFNAIESIAELELPISQPNGQIDQAVRAMQLGQPVLGQELVAPGRSQLLLSAYPAFDNNAHVIGALLLVYRVDVGLNQMLRDTASDFGLRVSINNTLAYERPPTGGISPLANQFRLISAGSGSQPRVMYDVTPGERVIKRNLTPVPALVLLFAWASLLLLSYALFSERRAQALLREHERVLDGSLDMICTLDINGRYATVNEASRRVLGYAPEEMIGRYFLDFAHPHDAQTILAQWHSAQQGAQLPIMPLRFVHKDGRTVFLQGTAHWSAAEQLFYSDMRDVTEQHGLEVERHHAENTLRAGVEQAGCVVYELLPASGQIRWVGAVKQLTGLDPEEFGALGFEGWMNAIHPDDALHTRRILQRCMETLQPHTTDYRLRRKDGSYVPVLDRGRHLTVEGPDAPRMIGALLDLSTIRQQEAALRRSEERYRIIATQVGAVIIERESATGRVLAYGPVENIFGYTKEQMEGRPARAEDVMIHPEDRARVAAAVADAERNLSSYYVEYRRRHRGGHYIYIATRGVFLPGPDGRAERSVIAVTDITERRLAAQRLQENEERFRLAAEQANQIVYEYVFDENLRVVQARFAGVTERLVGYSSAELYDFFSKDRFALVHPDDLDKVRRAGSSRAGNSDFQIEHRTQHKSGHYIYVENRGAVRRDASGNVTGVVGMLLDVSARTAADLDKQRYTAQLRSLAEIARKVSNILSAHELLNTLARSMRDLIGANAASALLSDATLAVDRIVAVSYAERYGLRRTQLEPLGSDSLHAVVRENNSVACFTREQIASDPRWAALTQNDDLHHPLRGWLAAPLIARDGTNLGLLELSDKIEGDFTETDLQVLNQLAGLASVAIENIRLYATLEERVVARTRELEVSNRELEAFSYSVSHDLRAPLRAIAGFSSILEHEYGSHLKGEARRYLQRITGGVERMANLIDDLLSLARVSRVDLKREAVDMTALCRTIVKRQKERWPDRHLDITIDARMRATADSRLVEVALENLIENALKFTSTRAESLIHIGQRKVEGRAAFFVKDNGVGFDPQYASNLFGVFQRLHSASEFPGTGVGLATVQRIVQRHHGRAWAESQIDQGAVFYFTLHSEV
ncbi:MAG: PAS domain-containing protein, partial [Candidatus Obscuribacterales bacterium]|nr:PAS domain-containing protein [Steroidobacteraceae bacterium]